MTENSLQEYILIQTQLRRYLSLLRSDKLYNQKINRDEAVRELITTEETYVSRLRTLVEVFKKPLVEATRVKAVLKLSEIDSIFLNVEEIYIAHQTDLLKKISKRWENWRHGQKIGDVFEEISKFLSLYGVYCGNYEDSFKELERLRKKRSRFRNRLFEMKQHPDTKKMDIISFLILPVQRVPRYNLLLSEILKHTPKEHPDYENLSIALEKTKELSNEINKKIQEYERLTKLTEIQSYFDSSLRDLVKPNRDLEKTSVLGNISKANTIQKRYFFLFTDILIIADRKLIKFRQRFSTHLGMCWILDLPNTNDFSNLFLFVTPKKTIVTICKSHKDKKKWMEVISKCIDKLVEKNPKLLKKKANVLLPKKFIMSLNAKLGTIRMIQTLKPTGTGSFISKDVFSNEYIFQNGIENLSKRRTSVSLFSSGISSDSFDITQLKTLNEQQKQLQEKSRQKTKEQKAKLSRASVMTLGRSNSRHADTRKSISEINYGKRNSLEKEMNTSKMSSLNTKKTKQQPQLNNRGKNKKIRRLRVSHKVLLELRKGKEKPNLPNKKNRNSTLDKPISKNKIQILIESASKTPPTLPNRKSRSLSNPIIPKKYKNKKDEGEMKVEKKEREEEKKKGREREKEKKKKKNEKEKGKKKDQGKGKGKKDEKKREKKKKKEEGKGKGNGKRKDMEKEKTIKKGKGIKDKNEKQNDREKRREREKENDKEKEPKREQKKVTPQLTSKITGKTMPSRPAPNLFQRVNQNNKQPKIVHKNNPSNFHNLWLQYESSDQWQQQFDSENSDTDSYEYSNSSLEENDLSDEDLNIVNNNIKMQSIKNENVKEDDEMINKDQSNGNQEKEVRVVKEVNNIKNERWGVKKIERDDENEEEKELPPELPPKLPPRGKGASLITKIQTKNNSSTINQNIHNTKNNDSSQNVKKNNNAKNQDLKAEEIKTTNQQTNLNQIKKRPPINKPLPPKPPKKDYKVPNNKTQVAKKTSITKILEISQKAPLPILPKRTNSQTNNNKNEIKIKNNQNENTMPPKLPSRKLIKRNKKQPIQNNNVSPKLPPKRFPKNNNYKKIEKKEISEFEKKFQLMNQKRNVRQKKLSEQKSKPTDQGNDQPSPNKNSINKCQIGNQLNSTTKSNQNTINRKVISKPMPTLPVNNKSTNNNNNNLNTVSNQKIPSTNNTIPKTIFSPLDKIPKQPRDRQSLRLKMNIAKSYKRNIKH
ncbi:faciogenital dysplasia protein [Anaeramoeba flamelloides]|uniref:Faciogenital dysplasia protein n=1 Tax=Anaeramoeba flamelloides TaxID=1746091 RepID=A0AAV8A8D0_9EUKA|nr:faciogenital dysplasia protein [Anaeramoeba flamelloides]